MKLYYVFISIFCIKFIGLFNCLLLFFLYNFSIHLKGRIPYYKQKYPEYKIFKYLENNLSKTSYIESIKKYNLVIELENTFYFIISNKYFIPIYNFYYNAENLFLIIIDEVLLMIYNLGYEVVSSFLMPQKRREVVIKSEENLNLLDSSEEDINESLDNSIDEAFIKINDENLIDRIKKQNKIPDKKNSNYENYSEKELLNVNDKLIMFKNIFSTMLDNLDKDKNI